MVHLVQQQQVLTLVQLASLCLTAKLALPVCAHEAGLQIRWGHFEGQTGKAWRIGGSVMTCNLMLLPLECVFICLKYFRTLSECIQLGKCTYMPF